jgi:hypothetical protein
MSLRVAEVLVTGFLWLVLIPTWSRSARKMKVIPLPMMLATCYNEYFQTYRKVMGLK